MVIFCQQSPLLRFSIIYSLWVITSGILSAQQTERDDASPKYVQEYIEKAVISYRKKDYQKSLEFIRHVISSDFNNSKLRYLAAHNYWRIKNYESAEAHFRVFLKIQPNETAGYIDLALMLHEGHFYKKAIKIITDRIKELKQSKENISIKLFNILARSSLHQKRFTETRDYLFEAKKRFLNEAQNVNHKLETLLIEAKMYFFIKNFEKAEISALWGSEIAPEDAYSLNLLGIVYLTWAENISDKVKKNLLHKNAKESFEKALYHINESSILYDKIKENLKKISL